MPAALRLMTIELLVASPETLNTPELNVAVAAALAGGLAATIAAAPSTTPPSSRRVARRQSLLGASFIVPPLGSSRRRCCMWLVHRAPKPRPSLGIKSPRRVRQTRPPADGSRAPRPPARPG